MALPDDGNGTIVDPEDADALAEWSAERAAAVRAQAAARAREAALTDRLSLPDVAAARAELEAAGAAFTQAQAAATQAQERYDEAHTAAARFAANELAQAETELDAATLALAQALAQLMKQASTSASLTAAVDGLALRERYRAGTATTPPTWNHTTIPFPAAHADIVDPQLALPLVGDPAGDYDRLLSVLARLDERVDAVADLVTAESVHQLVQGNPTRAGGTLALAAQGRVPDDLDVVRTPRAGHDVVHRWLVLTEPTRPAAWSAAAPGPAALADPVTAHWVSTLLPDPADIAMEVTFTVGATPVGPPVTVTLDGLGLDPLGWLRMAAATAELDARIARLAAAAWRAAGGAVDRVGPAPIPQWSPSTAGSVGGPSLADLLAAAGAAARLLGLARAVEPADLDADAASSVPDLPPGSVSAAAQRIQSVEDWTAQLAGRLRDPATDVEQLRTQLLAAASAGIAEAAQGAEPSQDGEAVRVLADVVATRLEARLAGAPFTDDPADPAGTLRRIRSRAEELCGLRLPVPVGIEAPGWLGAALDAAGNRLVGATPAAVRDWVAGHARVRPAVEATCAAYDLAELLGASPLALRIAQLPERDGDVWVGATSEPAPGTTSLVLQSHLAAPLSAQVGGLVLDTWTQAVPARVRDTAVAFHYDQPDNAAPQAILVAVHPDPDGAAQAPGWDLDTLVDVVTSILALARDRATAAERRGVAGLEVLDA